jgi:hypothetical protein
MLRELSSGELLYRSYRYLVVKNETKENSKVVYIIFI